MSGEAVRVKFVKSERRSFHKVETNNEPADARTNKAVKSRFDARKGSFYSQKPLPAALERVKAALKQPLGERTLSVSDEERRISASMAWQESIGNFPTSYHQIDLDLNFNSNYYGGTTVTYSWSVTDFPRGQCTNRLIRTINLMVASALMLL